MEARNPARQAEPAPTADDARKGFLLSLSERLRATADPAEVKRIAVEMLRRHLGTSRVGYREMKADGKTLRPGLAQNGNPPLEAFGSEIAESLRAGRSILLNDVWEDPRTRCAGAARLWESVQTRAAIAVPLFRERRLVTILFALDASPRDWDEREVQLMEDVAERTWDAVERARAEEALRESEMRLREMADAMPALISSIDADQRYCFVNQLYCEVFARPREQILGQTIQELVSEEVYEARRPYLERAFAGEHVTYEVHLPGDPTGKRWRNTSRALRKTVRLRAFSSSSRT